MNNTNTTNNNINTTNNNTNAQKNTQKKKGGAMVGIMGAIIAIGTLMAIFGQQEPVTRCIGFFMMSGGFFYEAGHFDVSDKPEKEQVDTIKGLLYCSIGTGVLGLFMLVLLFATMG
nr:MAG TPA: hypothetical protein [Caudoviricetes sp.]